MRWFASTDLKMSGTHPAHRRRGAANLQPRWAAEVADKHGACLLGGNVARVDAHVPEHGFAVKEEVVRDRHELAGGGKYINTSMPREP